MSAENEAVDYDLVAVIFDKDRGDRTVENLSLERYFAFGEAIKQYQETHPDIIVRSTQTMSRTRRTGFIRVQWWPRADQQHLGVAGSKL